MAVRHLLHRGIAAGATAERLRPCRRIGLTACADRVEIERPVGIGVGHGRQQRLRVGVHRIAEQLPRGASSTMRPAHITAIRSAM